MNISVDVTQMNVSPKICRERHNHRDGSNLKQRPLDWLPVYDQLAVTAWVMQGKESIVCVGEEV
jgi:hypothetical protein